MSDLALILRFVAERLRLPAWVIPPLDAVLECARVAARLREAGPFRATTRDVGVDAALVWLTLGEASPMTWRPCTSATRGIEIPRQRDGSPVEWRQVGVSFEVARAESWVALSMASGKPPPTAEDWRMLGVEPRPVAVDDDPEFAYGVWRTLSWLLGVREDFPIRTAWHRATGEPPERPHLLAPLRGGEPDLAWFEAEKAAQERARAEAVQYWRHVRARVDAGAGAAPQG